MESTQTDKKQIIAAALLLAVLAAGSAGCRPRQGTLNGDVFIVTEGAENVKLGLVEVKVLPYQETKNSIAQTKAQAEREIANMQAKLEAARKGVASAELQYKAAETEVDAAFKREQAVEPGSSTFEGDFDAARKAFDAAIDRRSAASNEAASARVVLANLGASARHWNSGALYFERLPSPVASTKTDGDGKFSVTVDTNASFALAAHATRRVFDRFENYYWIVSVSLDGQPSKRIFLSNDNLATSDSKDSLVHVIE